MSVVDTNVLVYAADGDSPCHRQCRRRVEEWRRRPENWYVTWAILYEFLRVTTHARVMRRPWNARDAWRFVDALLASPGLRVLIPGEQHPAVAAEVLRELPHLGGNLMQDTHTAILMREHGIARIYTLDTDFHRFPFLEVLDPLAETPKLP